MVFKVFCVGTLNKEIANLPLFPRNWKAEAFSGKAINVFNEIFGSLFLF